ncbi:MAG: response regulator transcription factor [Epulopiscium sp.]|nr:response regulator transcription factor [Candidatus Epulonipiscium sp.]
MITNILICDDELWHRKVLRGFIMEVVEEKKVCIEEAESGIEAIEKCKKQKYEIIFMDIKMGAYSGLEAGKIIRKQDPFTHIVFVTSYNAYVFDAVKQTHCYDYILKPVKKEEFHKTLQGLLKKIYEPMVESTDMGKEKNILRIQLEEDPISIPFTDILFIEKKEKLSVIHTYHQIFYSKLSLGELEDQLTTDFFRTHKSYIVNMESISSLRPFTSYTDEIFFQSYSITAKCSARKRKELKQRLKYYKKGI